MPATEYALLQDVIEHADDDAPRLVFADWLEERGDPRAEFIRVQCELETLDADDPRRSTLRSRELQLIRQHSKGWARPLRPFVRKWWFRRGFIERVELPALQLLEHRREFFAATPVRRLQLLAAGDHFGELSRLDELARIGELSLPRSFDTLVQSGPWYETNIDGSTRYLSLEERQSRNDSLALQGTRPLFDFLAASELPHLKTLSLEEIRLGDEVTRRLVNLDVMSQLGRLDLRSCGLSAEGVEHIVESPKTKQLTDLGLCSCRNIQVHYTDDVGGPLPRALAKIVGRLSSLDLTRCCITPQALVELTAEDSGQNLVQLSLNGSMLTDMSWVDNAPSFSAAIDRPLFDGLHSLDLGSCYLDPERLSFLLSREGTASIRSLTLNNNDFAEAGVAAIVATSNLTKLEHLDLTGAASQEHSYGSRHYPDVKQIKDAGVELLASATRLPRLASLNLRNNGITPQGIGHLVAGGLLDQLYRLDLSRNQIGDEGAEMLTARGHWPKLACLNVRQNGISPAAREKLRASFGYRVVY